VESHWEFPRHQLRFISLVGEGCFGQVWKYEALEGINNDPDNASNIKKTPTTVAVKTLKSSAGEKEKKDLLHELAVMKMLEPHPNVVRLLGCCTEKGEPFTALKLCIFSF